ncbi:hypothetical protein H5410_046639 [Solanum commersonii]|uniref:Uncharacterized protein n=1 Tax=Solanum commersonii TaxID=4109 RepID=A0A9J5XEW0_SOLCO|nr:hypothetical protein H5410_046639 [Solanum commersonii]
MAKAKTIEAFDLLLNDLMDMRMPFGGKVVVLGEQSLQELFNLTYPSIDSLFRDSSSLAFHVI